MAKTNKKWQVVTPRVIAKFIDLPYVYSEGGAKSNPKYKVTLVLDPNNSQHALFLQKVQKYQEQIKAQLDKMLAKVPAPKRKKMSIYLPLEEEFDAEGNPTGMYILKASSSYPPVLIDAKKNEIKYEMVNGVKTYKLPGYNPEVKCGLSFSLVPYVTGTNAGATCYLSVIQIIKVQSSVDLSAFDEVDDGFTADEGSAEVSGDALVEDDDTPPNFGDF